MIKKKCLKCGSAYDARHKHICDAGIGIPIAAEPVGVSRPDNSPRKGVRSRADKPENQKRQGDSSERRPTFDRVKYQREYMRKWRAAKKAKEAS